MEIRFSATATPIDSAPPVLPPAATAMEAAPASALIVEESVALRVADLAFLPVVPSPSIKAFTKVAILFSVTTPEPLPAKLVSDDAATATEPAPTLAIISPSATAVNVKSPPAWIRELRIYACTKDGWRSLFSLYPIKLLAMAAPTDAPTPVLLPIATEPDTATTIASISELLSAVMSILPILSVKCES